MNRLDVLISAREKIANGWITGHLHLQGWRDERGRHDDQYCAVGAIRASTASPVRQQDTVHFLETLLDGNLMRYNDRQRSVEPVLALFDKAIKLEWERKYGLTPLAQRWNKYHTRVREALDTPYPVHDLPETEEQNTTTENNTEPTLVHS